MGSELCGGANPPFAARKRWRVDLELLRFGEVGGCGLKGGYVRTVTEFGL